MLVYDVSRRETYDNLNSWLEDCRRHANEYMTITLVGNKVDGATAQRQVSEEEGLRFARENGLLYVETSAMTSANVDNAFIETARVICNKIEEGYLDPTNEINGVKIGYMPGGRHHHHHDQNREGDSRSGSVTIEDVEKERATGGYVGPVAKCC